MRHGPLYSQVQSFELKLCLVDQGARANIGGSVSIVRDIIRKEGAVQGLYRGLTPNIIGNSISWGLYYMYYGNIKDLIRTYRPDGNLTNMDNFLAAGAAGLYFEVRSKGTIV